MDTDGSSSAPPRVEVASDSDLRQDSFVPSSRLREDGPSGLRGWQREGAAPELMLLVLPLGRGKRSLVPGGPLQVKMEPVVPVFLGGNENFQVLWATRSMLSRM